MQFWRGRSSSRASTSARPTSAQSSGDTHNTNNHETRAVETPSGAHDSSGISDDYEVVTAPSHLSSSSNVHTGSSENDEGGPRRRQAYEPPLTPGYPAPISPPPQTTSTPSLSQAPAQAPRAVRQMSSIDWYPDWLPRRPAGPAPASTVPSERGVGAYTPSPIPFQPASGGNNTGPHGRMTPAQPAAPGRHRASESYDTGYTAGTGYTGLSGVSGYGQETEGEGEQSYVDVGELEPTEDEESRIGIGRRQTPRSVRIVSVGAAGSGSRRKPVASGSVGRKPKHGHSHSHGGGQQGPGSRAWWRPSDTGRGTFSAGSPTVYAPSPGVRSGPLASTTPASAIPPHMRAYLPQPAMISEAGGRLVPPRPRFRANGLHLNILRSPSKLMYLWYLLWPLWFFGLILIQSLLDLVAVWSIIEIALHPTPASPPSSSLLPSQSGPSLNSRSSRNWSLAAAAYVFCWAAWIFGVIIIFEAIVGWWRRWRFKRPLVLPLYLNSAAFNYVCMTSFENFCFFRYVRSSARPALPFKLGLFDNSSSASSSAPSGRTNTPSALEARDSSQRERGGNSEDVERGAVNIPPRTQPTPSPPSLASWHDYFAETFFFYSQNLPTVSLLVPRAALCLALLLAFSSAPPEDVALAALGLMDRDRTFYRSDGSLSGFARGVLWTNVAWTGWRTLILAISWVGIWWASGMRCAGVCGPSGRWEEELWQERKATGIFGAGPGGVACVTPFGGEEDEVEEREQLQASWAWKECTKARLFDAYDLCMDKIVPSARAQEKQRDPRLSTGESESEKPREGGTPVDEDEAMVDRVLAAAGLPRAPLPARRGKLREELFDTPPEQQHELPEIEEIPIPKATSTPRSKSKSKSPKTLSREHTPPVQYAFKGYPAQTGSQDIREGIPFPPSPKTSTHPESVETSDVEGEVEIDVEGEEEEGLEGYDGEDVEEFVEEPSSGRASGSMSSLGAQIPSRFPFQFRHVTRRSRGGRSSVSASTGTKSRSTGDRTKSTPERQRESRESGSMQSPGPVSPVSVGSSGFQSPTSPRSPSEVGSSPIPMPPRAARRGTHRRQRSSMPSLPVSPVEVAVPMHIPRSRAHSTSTAASETFGPHPEYETSDEEEVGVDVEEEGEEREERMMLTDPEPEGSQEEAERGDSVGLLSGGPSPRSSVGGLRSRSNLSLNSLSLPMSQRRRSRHSSASSHSYGNGASSRSAGSRAHSLAGSASGASGVSGRLGPGARSRSLSTQARSRAHSFIQSVGAASHSTASIDMQERARSRAHSTNSGSSAAQQVAAFGSAFVPRSARTASGSGSGTGTSRSGERSVQEDYTFGQPLHQAPTSEDSHDVRSEGTGPQEVAEEPEAEQIHEVEPTQELHRAPSSIPGTASSDVPQQTAQATDGHEGEVQPQPSSSSSQVLSSQHQIASPETSAPISTPGPRPPPSFISSAHESMVTQATAREGGSSSDPGAAGGSSYGTVTTFGFDSGRRLGGPHDEHLPGQGGGWRPA